MTYEQLERRVIFLSRYAVGVTLALVVLILGAAGPPWWTGAPSSWWGGGERAAQPTQSDTDTVRVAVLITEQVRVVEPDGSLALLASNAERMPGVVIDGDTLTSRRGNAGLLFFDAGEEAGGLSYRAGVGDDGEPYAWRALSFDQYRTDRVINLHHGSGGSGVTSGLRIYDLSREFDSYDYKVFIDSVATLPENERDAAQARLQERFERGEFGGQRVALESDHRIASLRLSDYGGRGRLRAVADSVGAARIEFLDAEGNVVRAITASE